MNSKIVCSDSPSALVSMLTLSEEAAFAHAPYAYKDDEDKPVMESCFVADFTIPAKASFSVLGKHYDKINSLMVVLSKGGFEDANTIAISYGGNEIDSIAASGRAISELPDDIVSGCKALIAKGAKEDGGFIWNALSDLFSPEEAD